MNLYLLEPEVAGDFGGNTIVENFNLVRQKGERPKIKHLHYNFTGWLGDELLECTPCFIVTDTLAKSIKESTLTGYDFENIEISADDEFKEMHPDISLPRFMRFIPKGNVNVDGEKYTKWSGDDFCLS